LLIGATTVSLIGNVAHAMLPYISPIVIQIGAAAVPPIALLAAVHGIALAVRAGASGRVYRWAVGAVAVIGLGAFAVNFLALRDLMQVIGYSAAAWIFPAIIDTAVAVSTLMLVALGDKPARRARTAKHLPVHKSQPRGRCINLRPKVQKRTTDGLQRPLGGHRFWRGKARSRTYDAGPSANRGDTGGYRNRTARCRPCVRADASGVTTQPVEIVMAVLAASREGESINAAAKGSGINYRTAQRIVEAAKEYRQRQLAVVS